MPTIQAVTVSQHYGHEKWLAPERFLNKSDKKSNYRVTIDSDTWAMGCAFYYFITKGSHPFDGDDVHQIFGKIKEGEFSLKRK